MTILARALADQITPRVFYAWTITTDHLANVLPQYDDTGVTGPKTAPARLLALLKQGEGHVFKMYDDDGELYYTGRLVMDEDHPDYDDETALAGPLDDFGRPNAGAVVIKYPGHPSWTIG